MQHQSGHPPAARVVCSRPSFGFKSPSKSYAGSAWIGEVFQGFAALGVVSRRSALIGWHALRKQARAGSQVQNGLPVAHQKSIQAAVLKSFGLGIL